MTCIHYSWDGRFAGALTYSKGRPSLCLGVFPFVVLSVSAVKLVLKKFDVTSRTIGCIIQGKSLVLLRKCACVFKASTVKIVFRMLPRSGWIFSFTRKDDFKIAGAVPLKCNLRHARRDIAGVRDSHKRNTGDIYSCIV